MIDVTCIYLMWVIFQVSLYDRCDMYLSDVGDLPSVSYVIDVTCIYLLWVIFQVSLCDRCDIYLSGVGDLPSVSV